MEKEETLNFCTAKKRTLQSFGVKKADSANFCSAKKQTLQSLRGTLQNCTCIYYKFCVIARVRVRMFIQSHSRARDHAWITPCPNVDPKSHVSHIVTQLLSSSHNHLNHKCAVPPPRPQVTPTTTNNPRRPQNTTTG